MSNFISSDFKLGIMAGGQLGKMLAQFANTWDLATYVMDPEEDCPARAVSKHYFKGSIKNYDDVYQFGKKVDLLTVEIESVNTQALKDLQKEGVIVHPDPSVLELIQDKGLQKQFYAENNLPTSDFQLFEDKANLVEAINAGKVTYPFVQKSRKDGYDGKGVVIVKSENDIPKLLDAPCVAEDAVSIAKEIGVIAARNSKGDIECFEAVEMEFNPDSNLVEFLACPAAITEAQNKEAISISKTLIEQLNLVGLLAVELFIDTNGKVWINEVAPRPHNSGHHTIESHYTSQYEQHLRAILNLPLGSTQIISPSVMLNVLGDEGYTGKVKYEGLEECLKTDGLNIHIYGKKETRPNRKMGHITILAPTLEKAKEKAQFIKETLKVIA